MWSRDTFDENMKRVESLISLYTTIKKEEEISDKNKEYKFTDMLRAAVVFMHSSFETYYRSVIVEELKKNRNETALRDFPFVVAEGKEVPKITIADLAKFKEKKVSEVLDESIDEKLGRKSFNKYSDIFEWSKRIGIDLSKYKEQGDLEKSIQRRHKIVHEADNTVHEADNGESEEKKRLSPINPGTIKLWKEAYVELVNIIDAEIKAKGN